MIEKSYSTERQDDVSVADLGNGFTEVWLRRDHAQDTADDGPDGEPRTFWSCDEVSFTVQGTMTVEEAQDRFDELWVEHELDGVPAGDIAKIAREEAAEAKEQASQAGGADPQLQALARMQVATMSFDKVPCDDVVKLIDYWPEWRPDTAYRHNDPLTHEGRYFRASKDLTSQAIYPPGTAESEYYEVTLAPDGIIVWYQPGGAYNQVYKGEKRHYPDADGPVYEALEDTTYSPDAYPQHWKKAE